jgi:hypothetical protein
MPKLISSRVRHRMAELGIADSKVLAARCEIPWNGIRNAVGGIDPLSLVRVYAVARVLAREGESVRDVVQDILDQGETNDGVPDEPPAQPNGPKGTPRRKDSTTRKTGPKRTRAVA